jgi:histone deacetylase 8
LPGLKLQFKKRKLTATPHSHVRSEQQQQLQQSAAAAASDPLQTSAAARIGNEFKRTRTTSSTAPAVGYVFSADLIRESCRLPKVRMRSHLVHELICAYKLPAKMHIIKSVPATEAEMRSFHSEDYLNYVKLVSGKEDAEDGTLDTTVTGESFGLGYDCPSFTGMYETMRQIAGSSLSGIRALVSGEVSIAVNWCGGWHHSKSDEASGYCYVNDIVISILKLLDCGYSRILYVDFDLHHGDAVEQAFEHSHKVLTVSFHKYEVGFFPGTGDVNDMGTGKGNGYSVNMPFRDGLTDDKYIMVTREILSAVRQYFDPEIIVAQFGADGLTGDPMNSFSLTPKSLVHCVKQLQQFRVPILMLGGGGYDAVNTAKCWTRLTAAACQVDLANDIPDHSNFLQYRPHFELAIDPSLRKDFNSFDHLKQSVHLIRQRLSLLRKTEK